MIITKSAAELETMAEAGRITARALRLVGEAVAAGVSTAELDEIAEQTILAEGAAPAFKGYHGFPATLCTSLNEQVVHGIPSRSVRLRAGDILSVDVGAIVDGYYGDSAMTFSVETVAPEVARLLDVTARSLEAGIACCEPGRRLGDLSHAIQSVAEGAGFTIVREYVGHGIGRSMHEDPQVPNYGSAGQGPVLRAGMVFALEPMVNAGEAAVRVTGDGWTVVTEDGLPSAHFEHTVAVTNEGPRVLTQE